MSQGGKEQIHRGAAVRRERPGQWPGRREVSEGICHRDDAVERVVHGGPAAVRASVRVPLGSIVELVGDLDGTTLARTSDAARATSPVARLVSDVRWDDFERRDGVTCINADDYPNRRAQHRATANPKSRATTREHTVTRKHVRITARNRLVSGG